LKIKEFRIIGGTTTSWACFWTSPATKQKQMTTTAHSPNSVQWEMISTLVISMQQSAAARHCVPTVILNIKQQVTSEKGYHCTAATSANVW